MAKWRPYGTEEPSTLTEEADHVLAEFFQLTNWLHLKACLAFGTCLGFYRDGVYIPGDNDLDLVVVMHSDATKESLHTLLQARGFERKTSYDPPSGNTHFIKSGILLDVYPRKEGEYYKTFDRVAYKGHNYPIPHPVEEYLTTCYGDWKTPAQKSGHYRG